MKKSRANLATEERQAAASALIGTAGRSGVLDREPAIVSLYLTIGEEIDPIPLGAWLAARGHRLALPVMRSKAEPLEFRAWSPGAPVVERLWGIREPSPEAEVVLPDVLLLPMLAFDAAGYRLGYGGGFYDRSLALLRSQRPTVAVGLAFDRQQVDAVPHLAYDQRLDHVLTPTRHLSIGG
jgi:5-formyltetrahydrofolate cyclo-ligase